MKRPLYLLLTLGVALFVAIVVAQGADDVGRALAAAGVGILAVVAVHAVPLAFDIAAWLAVLPAPHRRPLAVIAPMRWYSEAINTVLPVAQVGGDVIRARLLARRGVPGAMAGASIVVDLAATIVSLIVFALIGAGLLLSHAGTADRALQIGLGIGAFTIAVGIAYVVHRAGGLIWLARLLERQVTSERGQATLTQMVRLDRCVRRLFRRQGPFRAGLVLHLLAWISGAAEVWLALRAMGHPATIADSLILESLSMAVRTAAFAIPGALGVQEGGLILLGGLLGIDGGTALALALIKRVRELAWGVPGVIAWQAGEGRRLFTRRPPAA